jgi:energy-coupling factor transporter transmembrane protein EcfT
VVLPPSITSLLIAIAVTPVFALLIALTSVLMFEIPVDKLTVVVTLLAPEKSVIDKLPVRLALVVLM